MFDNTTTNTNTNTTTNRILAPRFIQWEGDIIDVNLVAHVMSNDCEPKLKPYLRLYLLSGSKFIYYFSSKEERDTSRETLFKLLTTF